MKSNKCGCNLHSGKVAVIGAGNVGSCSAFAMMLDGVACQISLIDINKDKAIGEALDLSHGMQFTRLTKILAGDSFELVKDAEVIVICAGVAQKPGEARTDLLAKNATIFKQIIPKITQYNKDAILLVITNPIDVLTYITWKLSGFDRCRVFSSGTVLDTARLRYLLGNYFDVSPKDISAYILGEHGDSEFVWWSNANIGGVSLSKFEKYSQKAMDEIYIKVRGAAGEIIRKKGATNYAIALVVSKIVRAILLDQSRVFPVSTVLHNYKNVTDVCLSVPTIVRKGGVCIPLDIDLDEKEMINFKACCEKIKALNEQSKKYWS